MRAVNAGVVNPAHLPSMALRAASTQPVITIAFNGEAAWAFGGVQNTCT